MKYITIINDKKIYFYNNYTRFQDELTEPVDMKNHPHVLGGYYLFCKNDYLTFNRTGRKILV